MDYDNVDTIVHADNTTILAVKKLLHILKHKPEINRQLGSQSSYEIKTILIQAYPQHRKNLDLRTSLVRTISTTQLVHSH